MSTRHGAHIAERRRRRKSIVHDRAGRRVHWSAQRYGGDGGSGRGTVTGTIDNGAILVSVVGCQLQIGCGVGVMNCAGDIGPRGTAILTDLPLVSWSGAVGRFDRQPRI